MKNNVVSINVVQINAYILPPQDDGFPSTLHVGGTLPPWGDMDPAEREQRKKTTACISNEVAHALRLVGVPMWLHGDEPPPEPLSIAPSGTRPCGKSTLAPTLPESSGSARLTLALIGA